MKLVVEFLVIFKIDFSLKICSSSLKDRKAVLGKSDFLLVIHRQTQQSPLNLATYLLLSEQFWDEDKQWERQMAKV